MARLGRWCFKRRRTVVAAWLVGLVGFFAIGASVGASYNNNSTVAGTDSTQALRVLQADFPVQSGDSEQVVVQAKEGTLRSRSVEEAINSMLAQVSHLPHVVSVTSPYNTGQISRDGEIGFATVNLDGSADTVPTKAVSELISTAQSAASPSLNVQLGGAAIENAEPASFSSSFLVGILLALVVLFFAFRRSVLAALLPLVSALTAIGVATSVIDLLTHAVGVVSWAPELAVFIALGVGVDYALFIVSRHRSGLLAGRRPEEAAVTALNTSGRAVLLAGSTVCVAMLGMFALQLSFLYGVAVCLTVAVALTMLASLTLLPAMLGFLGLRVLRRPERVATGLEALEPEGSWGRWAGLVARRAAPLSLGGVAVIVLLAIPFFSLRQGLPDASTDQVSSTTYRAYELLAKGFGPGFNGPLEVVGQVSRPSDEARFASFVASLRGSPGVAQIGALRFSPNGKAAVALVFPTTGPQEAATTNLVDRVRSAGSRAEVGSSLQVHVGGDTAANEDYSHVLSNKMPQFLAVVVGLGFLLLGLVFRSLLVPLIASAMNLLSFGAALGVMTAVFQYGWGRSVFGSSGPIISWLPSIMFSILFGLSMDYEVFLVSRMHEEWALSGDNERAVTRGQAETGRVVTAAAVIMILVFGSFALEGQLSYDEIGLGFAVAIFVDAFVIRTVLVPAAMHVMGRANWWLPGWLDRALPHLNVEAVDLVEAEARDVAFGGLTAELSELGR